MCVSFTFLIRLSYLKPYLTHLKGKKERKKENIYRPQNMYNNTLVQITKRKKML